MSSYSKKIKIYWLAVTPTPYNKYLFDALKSNKSYYKFYLYYAKPLNKDLPFETNELVLSEDRYINKKFLIDFSLLIKAFDKNNLFTCVGWNDPTKLLILLIRSLLKLPYGFWSDSVPDNVKGKNHWKAIIKRYALKNATVVFTTGTVGIDQMRKNQYFTDMSRLISLPVFVPVPSKNRYKEKEDDNTLRMLALGRLIPRKGFSEVIKVAEELKKRNVNFTINIAGTGELESQLKRDIREKGLEKNIHMLGWVEPASLDNLYANCDLLLHLVTQPDPYPVVVLISLANGVPVIGSSLAGSVRDRIKDGYNGFIVPPSNCNYVADILCKKVLNDKTTMLQQLSENAYMDARQWSVDKGVEIVLDHLVKKHRAE